MKEERCQKSLKITVKEFLSDNRGEFDNKDITPTPRSSGITQHLTAPSHSKIASDSSPEASYQEKNWAELIKDCIYITCTRVGIRTPSNSQSRRFLAILIYSGCSVVVF